MSIDIESVKSEVNWIVEELEDIANGVDNNLDGIGEYNCATFIRITADKYREVKSKLDNINTNSFTEQWKKDHPEVGDSIHGGGGC